MDSLKVILLVFIFGLTGCAKLSYLLTQGKGQLYLITAGKVNEKLINDPSVDLAVKSKLKKIEEYKSFFYSYFSRKKTDIYTKTILLDRDAVSYLLILSPYDRIQAKKECFPIVGCFPYLGFFDEGDAEEYAKKGLNKEMKSYIRPVYAYSTLGHFNDRVLSSFFRYDDFDLAELIFHEIFHAIFFIKDEVAFNENLATFFAEKLTDLYFENNDDYHKKKKENRIKRAIFSEEVSKAVVRINLLLEEKKKKKSDRLSFKEADELISNYLKNDLTNKLTKICLDSRLSKEKCRFDFSNWNSAKLAAFATYNRGQDKISNFYVKNNLSVKEYLNLLEKKYKEFTKMKNKSDEKFEDYFYRENSKTLKN